MRYNSEIGEYNSAAKQLMEKLDVKVNDLMVWQKNLMNLIMLIGCTLVMLGQIY